MRINIRPERVDDYNGIADMYFQAFADVFGPAEFVSEVVLVDVYRHAPSFDPELALVAEVDGKVAGHIIYFPHAMMMGGEKVDCAFLAIVGVLPQLQKLGIGARLIEAGLERAMAKGYCLSVVLGHETYYPRFGYKTKMWGTCEVKVKREDISGQAQNINAKPVRNNHIPQLQQMWQTWHGETDLAIVPGNSISEWSTHAKHVKAEVFLNANDDVVGYARYQSPEAPGCLLAKSSEDLQDILAWLLAKAEGKGEITLPVHPQSEVGTWAKGEKILKPWDVGMLMELNANPQVAKYIQDVEAGDRSIGLMLWPALLTSVE